jgi:hypothetical protein
VSIQDPIDRITIRAIGAGFSLSCHTVTGEVTWCNVERDDLLAFVAEAFESSARGLSPSTRTAIDELLTLGRGKLDLVYASATNLNIRLET